MNHKKIFPLVFFYGLSCLSMQGQEQNIVALLPSDSPQQIIEKAANVRPSERQLAWQKQELTAFIHFGINTFTGKEWGEGKDSPLLFNPTRLDAKQWVKTLKKAGFKTVILTCKHHDGFCLWPSAYTDYSVKSSPWRNGAGNVVREVSKACQKYGVGFGVYLSPWDRYSSLYGQGEPYNDYFVHQLTELLTQYGPINEVWFDGACGEGPNGKSQTYDFVRWYKVIRQLQPQAVIAVMGPDVRWVGTESGRGRETEWSVVPKDNIDPKLIAEHSQKETITPPVGDMMGDDLGSRDKIMKAKALVWYPAETDVSIRPGWFYHSAENNKVKTSDELVDIYFSSVGRNSVLLLNVPPSMEGKFHKTDIQSLLGFRKKLDKMFQRNLLSPKISKVKYSDSAVHNVVDSNYETAYSPQDGPYPFNISFELKKPITFSIIALQEDISKGQRVEAFSVEVKGGNNQWKQVAQGTTIGYKRLLRIPFQTTTQVRINITKSRGKVHLAEVGVY